MRPEKIGWIILVCLGLVESRESALLAGPFVQELVPPTDEQKGRHVPHVQGLREGRRLRQLGRGWSRRS